MACDRRSRSHTLRSRPEDGPPWAAHQSGPRSPIVMVGRRGRLVGIESAPLARRTREGPPAVRALAWAFTVAAARRVCHRLTKRADRRGPHIGLACRRDVRERSATTSTMRSSARGPPRASCSTRARHAGGRAPRDPGSIVSGDASSSAPAAKKAVLVAASPRQAWSRRSASRSRGIAHRAGGSHRAADVS